MTFMVLTLRWVRVLRADTRDAAHDLLHWLLSEKGLQDRCCEEYTLLHFKTLPLCFYRSLISRSHCIVGNWSLAHSISFATRHAEPTGSTMTTWSKMFRLNVYSSSLLSDIWLVFQWVTINLKNEMSWSNVSLCFKHTVSPGKMDLDKTWSEYLVFGGLYCNDIFHFLEKRWISLGLANASYSVN